MDATRFIRSEDGVELPATGRWLVAPEHVGVGVQARGWLVGVTSRRAAPLGGELIVTDDARDTELRLWIDGTTVAGRTRRGTTRLQEVLGVDRGESDGRIGFRGRLVHADRMGGWVLAGELSAGELVRRATATLEYRGVFQPSRDGANAWLTGTIVVDRGELGLGGGRATRSWWDGRGRLLRRLALPFDLLAVGPVPAVAAGDADHWGAGSCVPRRAATSSRERAA
jgi:hypothetical protein